MPFDQLIETLKQQYEAETGWGNSMGWTNQDFIHLGERINERTGVTLSHVTLKRIWGKVKYDSLPNTYTLDTLAQYLGYGNWRSFASAHEKEKETAAEETPLPIAKPPVSLPIVPTQHRANNRRFMITLGVAIVAIVVTSLSIHRNLGPVNNGDYTFSSKKVITAGVPNSVVFDFDARHAPGDSVVIQQSWDSKLRQKVSKYDRQHTSIYYLPDYYRAKLIVNNKIVKQHDLLIKSNGWVSAVLLEPVPVYFDSTVVMKGGKMGLPAEAIAKRNISLQPTQPWTLYSYVNDIGEVYSDDFVFETAVRNDYREGAAVCQKSNVYILCQGTAVAIPLCAKGCISDANLIFTNFTTTGKKEDLSAFGVDFSKFVKVRVECHNRKAKIFIDDKLAYSVNKDIIKSKIIGFDLSFQGTGSVDYVKLSNGKVNFDSEF